MASLDMAIKLEEARADAWLRQDKEALRCHLHDEYLEINIFGRFTKEQVLGELFEGHQLIEYNMTDHQLLMLGPGCFAISYRVNEKLRSVGQVSEFHCFVIAIYQREGENWLLRLWQITPLS